MEFTLCDLAVLIVATSGNVIMKISRILPDEIMLLNDLKIMHNSESDVCMNF